MADAQKQDPILKPQDTHATGAEDAVTTQDTHATGGDIRALGDTHATGGDVRTLGDTHATGGDVRTMDTHATSEPLKPKRP